MEFRRWLEEWLINESISQHEAASLLGVSQQGVSNLLTSESIVRPSTKRKVFIAFPEFEHYYNQKAKKNNTNTSNTSNVLFNTNGNSYTEKEDGSFEIKADIIPFAAYGSYLEHLEGGLAPTDYETAVFNVEHFGKGNYKVFRIKGDSMDGGGINDTPDKALVLGREIGRHLWKDGFHNHKYGCIILSKENIYHKDIAAYNPETGDILLKSRNELFAPAKINLNDVYQIFNVIKRSF